MSSLLKTALFWSLSYAGIFQKVVCTSKGSSWLLLNTLSCVYSVGERLVGGVHLPAGPRAANGQQQLLCYGEWVFLPAAAKAPSSCWIALPAAWESFGWIPLLLLLPLLSMTSCYVKIPPGAHVLDPPVSVGSLRSTQQYEHLCIAKHIHSK